MLDLERQIHDYVQHLDELTPRTSPETALERPPARPYVRPIIAFAGAAALILVIIGLVIVLSPFGNNDRPVIGPSTTIAPTSTSLVTTTTEAPTTTTEAPPTTAAALAPVIQWTRVDDPSLEGAGAGKIAVVGDDLYLVGGTADANGRPIGVIWRSSDGGDSWERFTDPNLAFSRADALAMNALASNGDVLVAVGWAYSYTDMIGWPMIWVSHDGTSWERIPTDDEGLFGPLENTNKGITSVIATDTGFVAAGDQIWTSLDGTTWTRAVDLSQTLSKITVFINDLTATSEGLVAVGQDAGGVTGDAVVMLSADGSEWVRVPSDDISKNTIASFLNGVTTTGDGLVAVGGEGNDYGMSPSGGMAASDAGVWMSHDGHVWSEIPKDSRNLGGGRGEIMTDIAAFDDVLVAVGYEMGTNGSNASGVVWESTNGGTTWARVADPDMVFGNFYAGWSGVGGVIRYGDTLLASGSATGDAAVWIGRK